MKLFKKLFKKKEIVEENNYPICEYCKNKILPHEQFKTFSKKKYHIKPCWKKIKKEVKRMSANGDVNSLKYFK